jgi:hypothetical protein
MTEKQPDYLAYLLRLRRARVEGRTVCRASLESSLTGKRLGFASLDELFEFLRRETATMLDGDDIASATNA